MRTGERETLGRRLARVCRHDPGRYDLEMDINGWVDIRELAMHFVKEKVEDSDMVATSSYQLYRMRRKRSI